MEKGELLSQIYLNLQEMEMIPKNKFAKAKENILYAELSKYKEDNKITSDKLDELFELCYFAVDYSEIGGFINGINFAVEIFKELVMNKWLKRFYIKSELKVYYFLYLKE